METSGIGGTSVAGAGGSGAGAGGIGAAGTAAATAGSGGTPSLGGTAGVGGVAGTGGSLAGGSSGAAGESSGAGLGGAAGAGAGGGGGVATGGTSGKGGASGAAGGAGAPGYRPCPTDGSPCKILPLGDSITWGVGDEGNGGYRGPLFASAVAAGKKITFTGSLMNGPMNVSGQLFPQRNEGHSGWGISEVTPYSGGNAGIAILIPNPALNTSSGGIPHIILLHIGTNDAGSFSAAQMTSDLSGFLDKLITNAPDAYLVVAQIIPLGYGTNDVIRTYNQSIPGLVQQRANAGKHIAIVDMFTGFTPSSMLVTDNIHPNTTGYRFMADHWYSVIGSLLPE